MWSQGLGRQVALEFAYLDGNIQTDVLKKAVLLIGDRSERAQSANQHSGELSTSVFLLL